MKHTVWASLPLILLAAMTVAAAQTITTLEAPCLADSKGNLFLRLVRDGSKLLINRSPTVEEEELVMLPREGTTEEVWHRHAGRSIYNQFAVSSDGSKVALAYNPGSQVYFLTTPGGTPHSIANVNPDGDVRQLALSDDGRWAAFTASGLHENGVVKRVQANLYVAATDGSSLYRITPAAIPEKFIAFALSNDGRTVVWVDDAANGPWIADVDGTNAKRLPAPPAGSRILGVHCNEAAARIYYQTVDPEGVKLLAVERAGGALSTVHMSARGFYEVSDDGSRTYLLQVDSEQQGRGSWWEWNDNALTKRVTHSMPRYLGSWAWSGDGSTLVWRDGMAGGVCATYAWRAAE